MNWIILFILLITVSAEADEKQYISFYKSTAAKLTPEYRLPIADDMQYEWKMKGSYPYKTNDGFGQNKAPYWTAGYFNNDDKIDYAYILIHRKNGNKQLFAFMSSSETYTRIKLGESHEYEMGIETQESGDLITASGKGYWKPTPDDPTKIHIKRHAISYFMFESAASVFVWDEKKQSFKRHWISD